MLDLLLRGGEVVDGTGAPRRRADVGIRAGRIVVVGTTDEPARRTVDITGLVVAPGFIDVHTHYDAQLLWDPSASPSPLHGVTTILGGNCGFTIAPAAPEHNDYVMRMMSRVEGIPLSTLQDGVQWDWKSFGEWLSHLEGRIGVNAGFMVGHSTIRRLVMGEASVGEKATDDQIDSMVRLLHEAMAEGGLGLSSSLGEAHTDWNGDPVPSRAAGFDEVLALSAAVRDHPGTSLEFIPCMGLIPDDKVELMADMSLAANRPLNWNLLGHMSPTSIWAEQLRSCDRAREKGATVIALTLPDVLRTRSSRVLQDLPGWKRVMQLPDDELARAIADPAVRAELRGAMDVIAERGLQASARWEMVEIAEATNPETEALVGRTVEALAKERGVDPVDVLIDVVLPNRLPLTLVLPSLEPELGASDEGWKIRAEVWKDERTVLGGSDAGAHLDVMCHANYTTALLATGVRERELLSLEEAVRQLSDVPARLYGLRDRGRVAEGWMADLVVFDADTVNTEYAKARYDLPGGNLRLYAESTGIAHVYVNGEEVVTEDRLTGALGGRVLRSGRDTDTVTVPGA